MKSIDVKRLFDIPYYQLNHFPLEKSLCTKYGDKWLPISTRVLIDESSKLSRGLLNLGVSKGDKIAIISSNNRTEWSIVDMGVLQIGAQNVPIYPTITVKEYAYILNHAEVKYCFISDEEILQKISEIKDNVKSLKEIYSFDKLKGCKYWLEVINSGRKTTSQRVLEDIKKSIKEDDLATIIYTSGTTGKPKGVMLSHKNILSNVKACKDRFPAKYKDKALSFLPVCHIYERMVLYLYMYNGISIYFAESLETIGDNLRETSPTIITAVPRLLEKLYDKIYNKGVELVGIKRRLFFWALELGMKYKPYKKNGSIYAFKLAIARKLIFSKWKQAMGGNIEAIVSGSAPLQERLTRVFCAAGIMVLEGYGLTESSPVISVTEKNNRGLKIGTVGRAIEGVEIKIASDGEILVKGSNIMQGYFKDEEKTNEIIKDDYLYTGDIGVLDSDGFLMITDRKKEMFKTSGGKYIAPQVIENKVKQSRFIEQIMVIGEGEKLPAAFIQISFDFVKEWMSKKNISLEENQEIVQNPSIIARIQKEIDFYNSKLSNWERIKKIELTPDVWSIESGHLTPTLKLKRKVIVGIYKDLYQKIYNTI